MSLYPDPQGFEDHSDYATAEEHTRLAGDVIKFPIGDTQRRIQQETAPVKPDGYTPAGSSVVPFKVNK